MVVFREANEYSGTPKCAYYVATMNSCEGSGHTSAFQSGAHQVPPRGVFVTAGREVLQTCPVHQTHAGPAAFPMAMFWDSRAPDHTLGCHPISMVHLWLCWWHRGSWRLSFPTGYVPCHERIHMWMALPPCLPGLALNKLKAERDVGLKGFCFVSVCF